MKLEVGKKYRNRKGDVKEIVWKCPHPKGIYSFADVAGAAYTPDGTFDVDSPNCQLDLIEEVSDKLYQQQEDGSMQRVVNHGTTPIYTQGLDGKVEKVMPEDRAKRFNSGKVPMHFVPLDMLQGLARVLEDGAVVYGEDNWRKGAPASEQIDSLLRHLTKLQSGEMRDSESGLPHVDHMLFNCISLRLALEKDKDPGQGNRVKETK